MIRWSPRPFLLLPLVSVLFAMPHQARAHTTEMLGGRLVPLADGAVELRLEVSAKRLPVFAAQLPEAYVTWGDVRPQAGLLTACFQRSLAVFVDGRDVGPNEVILSGLESSADDAALPEFVTVLATWRGLSFVPSAVIPRFDLTETFVILVLDENLGGPAAASADVTSAESPPPSSASVPAAAAPEPAAKTPEASAAPSESEAAVNQSALATPPPREPESATLPPREPAVAKRGLSWRMVARALVVGYEHIVPYGLDHILFVLGLFFAARRFRDLLWQVTMFTIAHSITLGLAMAGVVVLSQAWATAVEIGIAVSIVAVAVENCFVRQAPGWRRLAVVGIFGLIHGLGFAGALSEVNWPDNQFAVALLAANIGIELGQLTVVGAAALLVAWAWRNTWYRRAIAIPASIAIGACGLYWAIERTAGSFAG